jgi:hypothetical protein
MVRDSSRRTTKRKSAGTTDDDWLRLVHEKPMSCEICSDVVRMMVCVRHGSVVGLASRTKQQTERPKTRWYSSVCDTALAGDAAQRGHAMAERTWWFSRDRL